VAAAAKDEFATEAQRAQRVIKVCFIFGTADYVDEQRF
jgi:hypothetical protein